MNDQEILISTGECQTCRADIEGAFGGPNCEKGCKNKPKPLKKGELDRAMAKLGKKFKVERNDRER